MKITFPSFDPGTPGTLLDSENAKKVKTFIEAFNNVQIVLGNKNSVQFSENNVVITINISDLFNTTSSSSGGASDLHYEDSAIKIDIDQAGAKVIKKSSGAYTKLGTAGELQYSDGGTNQVNITTDGLQVRSLSNGADCEIFFTALARDMSLREISICDNGIEKRMLVLASAPYI